MRLRNLLLLVFAFAIPATADNRAQDRLDRLVRHELVMLPYYGVFDDLAFKVDGGKVTLLGQVTRHTLKTDAERTVLSIEGVEAVDNQIEVLPLSANDGRIRLAVLPRHLPRPRPATRPLQRQSGYFR